MSTLSRSLLSSLALCLGERDRQSRRWRRDERRIDWSVQEQFHVSAHSFKSRASAAPVPPAGILSVLAKCLCFVHTVYEQMCVNVKCRSFSRIHASSSRRLSLTFVVPSSNPPWVPSLISSLSPTGSPPKVSAFPLSSYSIRPRHHYNGVCTASALWRWCAWYRTLQISAVFFFLL